MSNVEYRPDSPYAITQMYGTSLDVYQHRPIPYYQDDVLFSISLTYQYRPDLLAFDLYNNSNLWWVFSVRNPNTIQDPIWDFIVGQQIYIPKQGTLQAVLGI